MATCVWCGKEDPGNRDPERSHAVYKCNRGHTFLCCSSECQRFFEKKCDKVKELTYKAAKKLSGDGRAWLVPQLTPAEKEKFKQYHEAEAGGLLLCPQIADQEKYVKFCACVMHCLVGTQANCQEVALESPAESPKSQQKEPPVDAAPAELVGDEQLQVIRREDEDEDDVKKPKKGKKAKKKETFRVPIDLVFPSEPPEPDAECSPPPSRTWAAGQPAPFRSIAPVKSPPAKSPPAQWPGLKKQGGNLSMQVASAKPVVELPDWPKAQADGWDDGTTDASNVPGSPSSKQAESEALIPESWDTGTSDEVPPPPNRRPPPPLPRNWEAVWSEEHAEYYYYNVLTNEARWNEPKEEDQVISVVSEATSSSAEASSSQGVKPGKAARQKQIVEQFCDIAGLNAPEAEALLLEHDWSLEAAIKTNSERQALQKAAQKASKQRPQVKAAPSKPTIVAPGPGSPPPGTQPTHEPRSPKREPPMLTPAECEAKDEDNTVAGSYVCIRHWAPEEKWSSAIQVLHGQRVEVSWMKDGWAFGRYSDDHSQQGYFSQEILVPAEEVQPRETGEQCKVIELFHAIAEGYMTVARGDVVKLLIPLNKGSVWAYLELESSKRMVTLGTRGWVPAWVLASV
mmetsp:Transcript_81374/g.143619  ORF Transcript_81374/g.143619 Transcript_81374/m.143619 type:complete len:626 (-) Transcript_81374:56-1933(-)